MSQRAHVPGEGCEGGESRRSSACISGGEFDSRTPVEFCCQSSNSLLLALTIPLLLCLGTATNLAEISAIHAIQEAHVSDQHSMSLRTAACVREESVICRFFQKRSLIPSPKMYLTNFPIQPGVKFSECLWHFRDEEISEILFRVS